MIMFVWRFHFELGDLKSPLIGLRIDLENKRTSGQNEVLPENLEADIQSQDQMYGLKYHNKRTTSSTDVQSKV